MILELSDWVPSTRVRIALVSALPALEIPSLRAKPGFPVQAIASRQQEWMTARWLLGNESGAYSISHSEGAVAVAIATDPALARVGVDFQKIAERPPQDPLRTRIAHPEDQGCEGLTALALFSLKEAAFKALPRSEQPAGMGGVSVRVLGPGRYASGELEGWHRTIELQGERYCLAVTRSRARP